VDTTTLMPPPPPMSLSYAPSSSTQSQRRHGRPRLQNFDADDNDQSICSDHWMDAWPYPQSTSYDYNDDDNDEATTPDPTTTTPKSNRRCHYVTPHQNQQPFEQYRSRDLRVPNVLRRREYMQYILNWLAATRTESCVAVVCHYHVIRAALALATATTTTTRGTGTTLKKQQRGTMRQSKNHYHTAIEPQNAQPIKSYLCTATGQLTLAEE
jgi:hypothetical protein